MNNIILGTGSYDNVKSGNTISITGDGGAAWGYTGPSYKKLAPKLETYLPYAEIYEQMTNNILEYQDYLILKQQIEERYIKSYYETRLKNLDVDKLLSILEEKYGRDIILLCHETIAQFCHRRLVADYIELQTGMYIPEVSVDEKGQVKKLVPIRYTEQLIDVMKNR